MKLIKDLICYLKYKEEINDCYRFALEEGYCSDETYSWRERLNYWNKCMNYEIEEEK